VHPTERREKLTKATQLSMKKENKNASEQGSHATSRKRQKRVSPRRLYGGDENTRDEKKSPHEEEKKWS